MTSANEGAIMKSFLLWLTLPKYGAPNTKGDKMEKVDVSGFPVVKINEPGDMNLKPGFRAKYEPVHHMTLEEQAEAKRLHAQIVEAERFDWVLPVTSILLFLLALYLATKCITKLYRRVKGQGRTAVVFSLFVGIRGARKISDTAKSLWNEAKEADRKVAEIERSGLE